MNTEVIVAIAVIAWVLLSIVVALAVGGMAKARDTGAQQLLDHSRAPGRLAPAARDDQIRTAV